MSFSWRNPIKAARLDPTIGREVVVEISAAEIIAAPNRYRTENILQAIAIATTELMILEETREKRNEELLNAVREIKEYLTKFESRAESRAESIREPLVGEKLKKKKKKKGKLHPTPVARGKNGASVR